MASHEIWLTTPTGARIANLGDNLGGYFSRVANHRAPFKLVMPGSFRWQRLCAPDRMIQFWRQPLGRQMSLWRSYFLEAWEPYTDASNDTTVTLWGYDANDQLHRRIVASHHKETESVATAEEADDLMKRIVTDSMLDSITPTPTAGTRALSLLSVQGDLTNGPQLTRQFAWDWVNEELVEIGEAAKTAGTEVFFDIAESNVTSTSIAFEFRTKTGQPGQDLSSRVLFSQENKSLTEPRLLIDYRDSVNYVYGVGQGEGLGTEVQQVYDATLYGASVWGRREGYAYGGADDAANGVREAARAALAEGRPDRTFSAKTVDGDGTRFGRDWNWGDKVRAKAFGFEFDCIIRTCTIYIDQDGNERIDAGLFYED
jgi:hypothetical protein